MKYAVFVLSGCLVSTLFFLGLKADRPAKLSLNSSAPVPHPGPDVTARHTAAAVTVLAARSSQDTDPVAKASKPSGDPQVHFGSAFGQKTAESALRTAARAFAERTGMRPSFETGIVSRDGSEGQAVWTFRNGDQKVKSLIVCSMKEDLTVVAFDSDNTFAANFPLLLRKVQDRVDQDFPRHRPWNLKKRVLNDGSSMDVPESWRLQGNQGMMSAEGPEGSVDYGCATQVFSPRLKVQLGHTTNGVLFADYRSPSQVHRDVFPQIAKLLQENGYLAARFVKINETAAVRNHVGPTEVIDYEWDRFPADEAVRWRSLALVMTVPMGDRLMYYTSAVHAPAASFPRDLRNLLRIWNSAAVSVATQESRLDKAAESLRAVSEMLSDANAARTRSFERSHRAWDGYIRGEDIVRDHETGTTSRAHTAGGGDIRRLLEAANQGSGYKRFELIDPKDVE